MNARRALTLILATSLAPACAGSCGSSSRPSGATQDPSARAANAESAPSASGPRRHIGRPTHHGGFVGLVLRAGREAALSDAQKSAVSDIQDKLHDEEPPLTALGDYQTDLAAGIRAGKFDDEKLALDYAAISKGLLARQAKQAEALDALYAALDVHARSSLVGSARARLNAMFRPRPDVIEAGALDAGGDAVWVARRVNRVKAETGFDDAQQAKITALVAKAGVTPTASEAAKDVIHKHADDLLNQFVADGFDAKKLDLTPSGGKVSPLAALQRETALIGQIVPLLTPEQREKLATARQRHAFARWTEDSDPWSPVEEAQEPVGPR